MNTREARFKEKQDSIIQKEKSEKRKKVAKALLFFFLILFFLFALVITYITTIGTTSLIIHEEKLTNTRLPSTFHGLKVIVFSDLHYPSTFLKKNLDDLKETINIRKPDLIFFTGDLLTDEKKVTQKQKQTIQQFLTELDANLGKYAVLGETDTEEAKELLELAQFHVLEDSYDLIYEKETSPILLIGLDTRQKVPDFNQAFAYFQQNNANQDIFTIALFHHPDTITALLDSIKVDYAFAGHSHNGQVRIPSLPPFEKREKAEVYSTNFYISSGLGTSISPYRFFARPSIFFFRFTSS